MAYNSGNMEGFQPNNPVIQDSSSQDFRGWSSHGSPRRRRRWPKVVAIILALALLATVSYAGLILYNVANISTKPLDLSGLMSDQTGRTNILVLGVGDKGHSGESLSDTIMVLSLDARTKRVAQISIPRDLRVKIPGYGARKINEANALGGVRLAQQTVSNALGIPVHYYIQTNFSGLKGMVDAVGGLDVNVKERLYDPEYPCEDNESRICGIDIQPGLQHMDGTTALKYARCRKGTCGNDFGRAERQQEVVNLLRDEIVQWRVLLNPVRLAPLTVSLRDSVQTDMGSLEIAELGNAWRRAQGHEPIRLVLHTGPGGYLRGSGDSSDLLPADGTFAAIQERAQGIFDLPVQATDLPGTR